MAVDDAWKRELRYYAPFFIFCNPLTPYRLGRFINGVAGVRRSECGSKVLA